MSLTLWCNLLTKVAEEPGRPHHPREKAREGLAVRVSTVASDTMPQNT